MTVRGTTRALLARIRRRIEHERNLGEWLRHGLTVGDNFQMMNGVVLDPSHCWLISIGNDVTLAPRVHIIAHDASTIHSLGHARIGCVSIGNEVFVGASTIILPGVKIGSRVIVGAGSVVTRDIPDNSVAVGSPARVVCTYDDYVARQREAMIHRPRFDERYTLRQGVDASLRAEMLDLLGDGDGYVV